MTSAFTTARMARALLACLRPASIPCTPYPSCLFLPRLHSPALPALPALLALLALPACLPARLQHAATHTTPALGQGTGAGRLLCFSRWACSRTEQCALYVPGFAGTMHQHVRPSRTRKARQLPRRGCRGSSTVRTYVHSSAATGPSCRRGGLIIHTYIPTFLWLCFLRNAQLFLKTDYGDDAGSPSGMYMCTSLSISVRSAIRQGIYRQRWGFAAHQPPRPPSPPCEG